MAEDTLALDGQGGVQVALGGDIIHWSTAEQGGAGEIFGILVAAIVLFLTLGVVAMGLPLLNALFAMVVSLSLMAVVGTRVIDVVDWSPQLAAMIGIGVGIDYALLILNRFRLERGAGRDVREATLVAIDTSGRAVLFAGVVVVIAMLGMMLLGISFLYGPAIAAALSVLFTMVAALTLMPALLSKIGGRVKPRGRRRRPTDRESGFAARWSGFVARRPLPVAILALAVLIALALPALHMRLATSDASTYKKDDTTRVAYDLLKEGFGARLQRAAAARGRAARGGRRRGADSRSATRWARRTGSPQVLPPQLNEAGDTATMIAYPTTTPQDERTDETVREARDDDAAADRGGDRRARLDRRHHREQPRLLPDDPRQAAAVHRRRRRPLAAAARGRLPLAADPGQGRHLQPALDRRRVRRRDADLPGRQPGEPVRRRHRPDRVLPADHGLRRRLRPVDGLRGVPRLPHARGVGAHQGRASTPSSTAWR